MWQQLERHAIDLVVLDLMLPDADGLALCRDLTNLVDNAVAHGGTLVLSNQTQGDLRATLCLPVPPDTLAHRQEKPNRSSC